MIAGELTPAAWCTREAGRERRPRHARGTLPPPRRFSFRRGSRTTWPFVSALFPPRAPVTGSKPKRRASSLRHGHVGRSLRGMPGTRGMSRGNSPGTRRDPLSAKTRSLASHSHARTQYFPLKNWHTRTLIRHARLIHTVAPPRREREPPPAKRALRSEFKEPPGAGFKCRARAIASAGALTRGSELRPRPTSGRSTAPLAGPERTRGVTKRSSVRRNVPLDAR